MANIPSSSSCSNLERGEWERCSVSHSQLEKLQKQGFLPPADLVPLRAALASFNDKTKAEDFPNPSAGERVCFVPPLLRGVGFPIHPFLRGLLEYYGLQLHIAGYVALCELFLGIEAHFELWRKLFCLVLRNHEGLIFEVGGAKIWRVAETG